MRLIRGTGGEFYYEFRDPANPNGRYLSGVGNGPMWGWIRPPDDGWEGNVGDGGNTWHQAFLWAAPDSTAPAFATGVFVNEDTVLVTQSRAFKIDDPGEFDALVALGHQPQSEVVAALGAITDQVEMTVAGADAALAGGRPTVAAPAGDDPILGNLLVTGFSSSEPPQRKSEATSVVTKYQPKPSPGSRAEAGLPQSEYDVAKGLQQLVEEVRGTDVTEANAALVETSIWFEQTARGLVGSVIAKPSEPEPMRHQRLDIQGAPESDFQSALDERLAPTSEFQQTLRRLDSDAGQRLRSLPEYVIGSFVALNLQRIQGAMTPSGVPEQEIIGRAKSITAALTQSKADYEQCAKATMERLHVSGTRFEQQVQRAIATKYLADPNATSESFFDPKLRTLEEITNGVQGVLPPDKKTAWPHPKPKPAAAMK